jgi:cellulose synthase/poly-beta-1,6-N-acetylglucosamine synthase-like glycosyltransferase
MKIRDNSFLGKAYQLNFRYSERCPDYKTNLCHFMRVMFFWLPLKILGFVIVCLHAIRLLFVLFFELIPTIGMWLHYTVWSAITAVFVAAYLYDNYHTPLTRLTRRIDDRLEQLSENETIGVISTWIKAKKSKICPLVEIVHENRDDDG